ncbi:leucine dehydrogenase [soil metagenome]
MDIFDLLAEHAYEDLVFFHDGSTGLRGLVAIHDTTLGPALGGCRMYPYASERDAMIDALRLARGMTYKAAAAGLDLGGGKSVIIGDPKTDKSGALFRAFGRRLETLGGHYIASEDVGVSTDDIAYAALETSHVVGQDREHGGSGDPASFTALGVMQGIRACLEEVYGSPSVEGRAVAVQGLGHVGYRLCGLLHSEGARLTVADVDETALARAVREFNATPTGPNEIAATECDVFAPCALGAVVNDESLPTLRCSIIAGSANNVLLEPRHGEELTERGILYAPDYIINAGGLINVAGELEAYDEERVTKRVMEIRDSVEKIIALSRRDSVPPHVAADTLAEERISAALSADRPQAGHPSIAKYRLHETL